MHGLWQGWGRAEDMQDAGATGEAAPGPAPHQQTNVYFPRILPYTWKKKQVLQKPGVR